MAVALFWLIGQLPWSALLFLGRMVGIASWHFARSRRETARTNIQICFPELSAEQQEDLARRSVISVAEGLTEMAGSYCNRRIDLSKRLTVSGHEHLVAAQQSGRGILLLGMHFSTLEVAIRLFAHLTSYSAVYRPNDNPVLDWLISNGRKHYVKNYINRKDLRGLTRALRKGETVWYAPDQDYGRKHAVFAPFFGHPAATITATSRIAKLGNAIVLPIAYYRRAHGHYEIEFGAPLEDFPSNDDIEDATRTNSIVEHYVRKAPEQYLWVHRRFKHQADGLPSPYQRRKR
tara:strand:+ start:16343 stop:17212 length:870 start_codon:yes stop_codon:yes gene_type:complete